MAKYKRAELTEDEDSVHLDHMKTHVLPIQPSGMWKSRSSLEKILLLVSVILFLCLCTSFTFMSQQWRSIYNIQSKHEGDLCLTPTCVKVASTVLTSMDFNVDPCNDFYQYACGGWIKTNPIPEGKSTWGTFQKLWQQNQLVIKLALEKETNFKSVSELKVQKYYQSCMDRNETTEKMGAEPLIQLLVKVGGWSISPSQFNLSEWTFQTQLQKLHNEYNMDGFFTWMVGEDDRNSTRHIIQIDQSGLTLPSREYYLNDTHAHVREAYLVYMIKVGKLLGAVDDKDLRSRMQAVLDFETDIAKITAPADERRDDEKLYHSIPLTELQVKSPFISWIEYFNNAFEKVNHKINNEDVVVVYAPEFLSNVSQLVKSKLLTDEGKAVINNYMVWHTVKPMTSYLSKSFRDAEKPLRKAIMGSDGTEETWRTCISDANSNMGFALGAMFIRGSFHPQTKPLAQDMIELIRKAFQYNMKNLKWMDRNTIRLASEKADAITDMIGYPEFILDPVQLDKKYDKLEINESEYFENNIRIGQFGLKKNLEKINEPVNKTKWGMTPPIVNAYYTPTSNQMVIPAGILQWPFFDPAFPRSVNFGAIGVVMGHELTHAFDDQGREYDKLGNMHQWWKNTTIEKFKKETECVVNQYSSYKIDGLSTLGENIADNGGLKAAFHAYKEGSIVEPRLPGLNITNDQLFFVSFAQVWCSSSLKETLVLQIQNDPHVPAPLRVSNVPEFSETFKCALGTPMNPKDKCTVW